MRMILMSKCLVVIIMMIRPSTCVSPKAGVVHGRVAVLVHKVHVGLVAEQQLYNLADRHYEVTIVIIIIINMIITTKANLLVSMGRGKM